MYSKEDLESKLEAYLNEFYHQRIVPLEKEIMRLGGDIDNIGDSIDIHLEGFVPKDPFIERIKNPIIGKMRIVNITSFLNPSLKNVLKGNG